jgi:hypothetical protein
VSALESTLDLQPREILEIVRLNDEVADLRSEIQTERLRMLREADRAFNTILTLVVGLMVAVLAMAIGNFLQRKP